MKPPTNDVKCICLELYDHMIEEHMKALSGVFGASSTVSSGISSVLIE